MSKHTANVSDFLDYVPTIKICGSASVRDKSYKSCEARVNLVKDKLDYIVKASSIEGVTLIFPTLSQALEEYNRL